MTIHSPGDCWNWYLGTDKCSLQLVSAAEMDVVNFCMACVDYTGCFAANKYGRSGTNVKGSQCPYTDGCTGSVYTDSIGNDVLTQYVQNSTGASGSVNGSLPLT